jgi:hypothetical protein
VPLPVANRAGLAYVTSLLAELDRASLELEQAVVDTRARLGNTAVLDQALATTQHAHAQIRHFLRVTADAMEATIRASESAPVDWKG